MSAVRSHVQRTLDGFATDLAELTDQVLLDGVWERPGLAKRERSLITLAALIANGTADQLRAHTAEARANGITSSELEETLLHLAFYLGWPKALSAAASIHEALAQATGEIDTVPSEQYIRAEGKCHG